MPNASGCPTCTGAPCTAGYRAVTWTATDTNCAGIGRIETTNGPDTRPEGRHRWFVTYMGTLLLASRCLTGTQARSRALSNVKLQPMRKPTRSGRQYAETSSTLATQVPPSQT